MSIATQTYAELFEKVSKSAQVTQVVKTAGWLPWSLAGLGLTAAGAGIPIAYALGQRQRQDEIDKARGQAYVAGLNTAGLDSQLQQDPDTMPDENAQAYYGLAPGINDVYGQGDFDAFGGADDLYQ
jgi:hypothetical protein